MQIGQHPVLCMRETYKDLAILLATVLQFFDQRFDSTA